MSTLQSKTPPALIVAIALSMAAVFGLDCLTPLGIAIWVLYFVPIALSKFAWRPSAPILTAAACCSLIFVGYWISPGHGETGAQYAPLNRSFGVVTFVIAAVIGRRFITQRLLVRREEWLKAAQTGLSPLLEGELTRAQLAENVLGFVTHYLDARLGALYSMEGEPAKGESFFRRHALYAVEPEHAGPEVVRAGEGALGQVAREKKLLQLSEVPDQFWQLQSGTGKAKPSHLVIAPAVVDGEAYALLELGFFRAVEADELEVLAKLGPAIAAATRSANYRVRQQELLDETQRQAEELQAQQEELRVQNEELEQQSDVLQKSQTQLENQQAELEQINSQLGEQAASLEQQRDELTAAQAELTRASTYKSEFLANMSHELRTPLNSSLILAKLLFENRDGNLTTEQVRFAQTIYSAGNDLLTLINDILDLSKIEAGKLDVSVEKVRLVSITQELESIFRPIANEKKLGLVIRCEPDAPATIDTDAGRLQQILKNLLSNALKFTERGEVTLRVRAAASGVAFDVTDTGIGIPLAQQEVVFEAFRQADGTTNRKHGGTGLGLSISRNLASLLGGEIRLESTVGKGSTFSLQLPRTLTPPAREPSRAAEPTQVVPPRRAPKEAAEPAAPTPRDDRGELRPGERAILIIEDDPEFAGVLQDLARQLQFKALVAHNAADGLAMADKYHPSAILLDVGLPDRSGLSVLDALKHNPKTRHIPVHVVSGTDHTQAALAMGATGYAIKPVEREQLVEAIGKLEAKVVQQLRKVLVVEDDAVLRDSTCQLIGVDGVECVPVASAEEALQQLSKVTFDCMVMDLSLPDRSGFELLDEMSQREEASFPPVIVYTGKSLSSEEEQRLRRYSSSIIIKGARSPERLLDEVTLFLHQVEAKLPPERQRMLKEARRRESAFEGRRVLVVEDDVRNVFALTSVLEPKGAKVEIARNGVEALNHLEKHPGVDLVLMDVMMPEMNGIEAMKRIRQKRELAKLPIIALTAKAMASDREECIAAGANDYISKPLDVDKLVSLARVWMLK